MYVYPSYFLVHVAFRYNKKIFVWSNTSNLCRTTYESYKKKRNEKRGKRKLLNKIRGEKKN